MDLSNRSSQISSSAASFAALYSASVDDLATVCCKRLRQLTAPPAMRKTYPVVDRQVLLSPAQSALAKYIGKAQLWLLVIEVGDDMWQWRQYLSVHFRYCRT